MTDQFCEDIILTTKRLRCDFIQNGEEKALRFVGIIVAEDKPALRAVYTCIGELSGGCTLDFTDVLMFDATLYSLLLWVRLTRERRGTNFAVVAREATEQRLRLAGITKWLPIFRDFASARAELFTHRTTN